MTKLERFSEERERLNEIVMKYAGLPTKRFFSLDNQTYKDGALPAKTKEMLGLVASLVLRCDDCILYHIGQCFDLGVTSQEFAELIEVGLIVGGSITIPHIRRAFEAWDELQQQ